MKKLIELDLQVIKYNMMIERGVIKTPKGLAFIDRQKREIKRKIAAGEYRCD